jgi:hypothetical protein
MVLPRAQHMVNTSVAMILGQEGGPNSTSLSEALSIRRWSSKPLEDQVVCPRPSGNSQRPDLGVGGESSRAACSRSLAETPRACRRLVAQAPFSLITFISFLLGCFL